MYISGMDLNLEHITHEHRIDPYCAMIYATKSVVARVNPSTWKRNPDFNQKPSY